jgi:taurine dioxygenase
MTFFDAQLARYKILQIAPVGPLIGATVSGVDLSDVSDESLRTELRRALADFQVLFFRKQTLTVEQHLAFARVFGDTEKAKAFFPRLPGQSAVEIIETAPNVPRYGVDQWHSDITFYGNPPTGTALYSRKIPPIGGDTAWASATAAYELLPESLKQAIDSLEAVHSFEHSGWPAYFEQLPDGAERYAKARADYPPVTHPVVRTHPVTGKKILYVNPNFTDRIKGFSRQTSDALLGLLFGQFEKPEVQARLRWEVDTVAIWDNRATVHYALNDYVGERLLHRVTFGEDKAF